MPALAEVLRRHWPAYEKKFGPRLLPSHRRAVEAILSCRTAALGGQLFGCACGRREFVYHSCRVKGFASRGLLAQRMLGKIMSQLFLQEFPATATFKKSLTPKGIILFSVCFIVNKLPRSAE